MEPTQSSPADPKAAKAGERDGWTSRWGAILAVAGSAVGLGNFLRFPGQAVQHGGGAFLLPYFIALLVLGIPLGWVEWTLGRYGGRHGYHSAPAILRHASGKPLFGVLGSVALLVPLVVYMYYGLIESWCLRYAWAYLSGSIPLGDDPAAYAARSSEWFAATSGIGGYASEGQGSFLRALGCWALVMAANIWLVYRGISRGIEVFCRWALPFMVLCAAIVLLRVLTLGTPDAAFPERSVANGLGYMWNPNFSALGDAATWLAAAGQVFFSLSVGFGVILTYASYLSPKDDVVLSSLTSSATNEVFEVGFGGLITVTAAFVFLGASGAMGGTFGLGFSTLPVVFAHMGALGRPIGAVWFSMLLLAAITSSLSMLFPLRVFLQEALGLNRRGASILLTAIVSGGSLWVLVFSRDLVALDTMDFWAGTLGILLLAVVELLCFGWALGVRRGMAEASIGAQLQLPSWVGPLIRYVSPLCLLIVLAGSCKSELPERLGQAAAQPAALATLGLIGLLLVGAGVLSYRATKSLPEADAAEGAEPGELGADRPGAATAASLEAGEPAPGEAIPKVELP